MKRIITVILAVILFSGFSLKAAPVSSDRAMSIARKILSSQPATKAGSGEIRFIWDGEDVATKAMQPAIYVFGRNGGGFVIIAGDDNVTPILGFSDRNEFKVDGMPDNVKWWMERMKAYVRSVTIPEPGVKEQWAEFVGTKSGPIIGTVTDKVEKLTPEWDQGNNDPFYFGNGVHVFNAKCPKQGGNYTLTGCVATALAELLTYQSGQSGVDMPDNGSGLVGGYDPGSGFVAPAQYSLGTVYDWENLRTLSTIADVKDAVDAGNTALLNNLGQLMADLGATVEASYSTSGTSASTEYSPIHLSEHFGFNKAAYYAKASDYSYRKWVDMLKNELEKRPLIYNGYTSGNAGHAFIFDGYGKYEGVDVFHVNFGWGGSNNGYYYHTNLDSENGNYSYNCGAVFDFYPGGSSTYPVKLVAQFRDETYCGVSLQKTSYGYIINYCIKNNGLGDYTGRIKFVRKKKDNSETVLMGPVDYSVYSGTYSWSGRGYFSVDDITFGERVICYYEDGDNWVQLGCVAGNAVAEWPLMPTAFIKTKAEKYQQNEWFEFALMNNSYRYVGTKWTITQPDGTSFEMDQSDYEFQLTQTGIYKIEAATAKSLNGPVIENLVTYIEVK